MRHATADRRALSVDETCHAGNFGRTSFYEFVSAGLLPARKLGRKRSCFRRTLTAFLRRCPRRVSGSNQRRARFVGKPEQMNRKGQPRNGRPFLNSDPITGQAIGDYDAV